MEETGIDFLIANGTEYSLNVYPLQGQGSFQLDVEGSDANFDFTIPAEVVEETEGLENLEVSFSFSPDSNSQSPISLALLW